MVTPAFWRPFSQQERLLASSIHGLRGCLIVMRTLIQLLHYNHWSGLDSESVDRRVHGPDAVSQELLLGLLTITADYTPSFTDSCMVYGQVLDSRERSLCVGPGRSKGMWMYRRSSISALHDVPQYCTDDEYCTSCMHAGVSVCPLQAACSSPTDRTVTKNHMWALLHESPAR